MGNEILTISGMYTYLTIVYNQFTFCIVADALIDIQKKELEKRKQIREIRKELRSEIDLIRLQIKLANIMSMPALVIIAGIIFFVRKRKVTAAK